MNAKFHGYNFPLMYAIIMSGNLQDDGRNLRKLVLFDHNYNNSIKYSSQMQ